MEEHREEERLNGGNGRICATGVQAARAPFHHMFLLCCQSAPPTPEVGWTMRVILVFLE